jgi:glutathione synthase
VQPGETNAFDQRQIEFALWSEHSVRVIRKSLNEIDIEGVTDATTGKLSLAGVEIGLCYYRAGYAPYDYPTEVEWNARLLLEKARCAKCPSIADHLSGAKKIQQALAMPGVIERYMVDDTKGAELLRTTFTGLHSLAEDEGGAGAAAKALETPTAYVMKPQREGGGNLLVGDEMCTALRTMSLEERASYILMDRINPPEVENYIMRGGKVEHHSVLSELGMFHLTLMDGPNVVENIGAGYLLRSKPQGVEDGGVAAGRACLDAPFLWGPAEALPAATLADVAAIAPVEGKRYGTQF